MTGPSAQLTAEQASTRCSTGSQSPGPRSKVPSCKGAMQYLSLLYPQGAKVEQF